MSGWCWLGPCATSCCLTILRGVVPLLLRLVGLSAASLSAWDEGNLIGVNLVLAALVAGVLIFPAVLLQTAEDNHGALPVLRVVLQEVLALLSPESHINEGGFAVFPLLGLLVVLAGVVGEGELNNALSVWCESLLRLPSEVAADSDVVCHLEFHFFELAFVDGGAAVRGGRGRVCGYCTPYASICMRLKGALFDMVPNPPGVGLGCSSGRLG